MEKNERHLEKIEKKRGDGAEPRLIHSRLQPDEHPPDHNPWESLSITQQLASPPLLTMDYSQATASISLPLTAVTQVCLQEE